MGNLPESISRIPLCFNYLVYCNGQKRAVIIGAGGEEIDGAVTVAESPDGAVVKDGCVDCSRMYCHSRDASGGVMRQVGEWMRR
jgi:hypothetical protein